MEDITDSPVIIKRSHYQSSLVICLMVSVGICAAIVPNLPFEKKTEDDYRGDLTYLITRVFLIIAILVFETFVWFVVRNRDKFHKSETVFWPLRCRHCAEAVGFQPRTLKNNGVKVKDKLLSHHRDVPTAISNDLSAEKDVGSDGQPSDNNSPSNKFHGFPIFRRSKSLDEEKSSRIKLGLVDCLSDSGHVGKRANDISESTWSKARQKHMISHPSHSPDLRANALLESHNNLYHKPHMSLLKTFYIFGTIAAINIPLPIIANIMCAVTSDKPFILNIVIAGQIVLDVTFVFLIFFGMLFFKNFYDAAFVDKGEFRFPLALTFASCWWIAAVKLLYPMTALTKSEYGHVDYPCRLPGKFGRLVSGQETMLNPFYAECAIISAAMVWQILSSTVDRALLIKTNKDFQSLGPTYNGPILQKIHRYTKALIRCRQLKAFLHGQYTEERRSLLPATISGNSSKVRDEPLNMTFNGVFCVLVGIVHFSILKILDYSSLGLQESLPSTEMTKAYLKWFVHIVFYLPLLAMYRFRIYLTDSAKNLRLRPTVSLVSGLIEGHDRIILISSIGIFTLNIFRLASSLGILFGNSRPQDENILACFTGIFAIFKIYSTWVMTSFIVVVQRQEIIGANQTKWILICLIYTGILNATQWAIDNMEINQWVELTVFYGEIQGMAIGVLLEPIASLYGIHSAMITYEAYKSVRKDFHSRRKMSTEQESYI